MELHHAFASSIQAAVFPSKQQVNESHKKPAWNKVHKKLPNHLSESTCAKTQ